MLRKQTNSLFKTIKQVKFYGAASHSHHEHHTPKDPNAPPTLKEKYLIDQYDDHHTPYTDFDGRFSNESVKNLN
jgi:hypothetical protein